MYLHLCCGAYQQGRGDPLLDGQHHARLGLYADGGRAQLHRTASEPAAGVRLFQHSAQLQAVKVQAS